MGFQTDHPSIRIIYGNSSVKANYPDSSYGRIKEYRLPLTTNYVSSTQAMKKTRYLIVSIDYLPKIQASVTLVSTSLRSKRFRLCFSRCLTAR